MFSVKFLKGGEEKFFLLSAEKISSLNKFNFEKMTIKKSIVEEIKNFEEGKEIKIYKSFRVKFADPKEIKFCSQSTRWVLDQKYFDESKLKSTIGFQLYAYDVNYDMEGPFGCIFGEIIDDHFHMHIVCVAECYKVKPRLGFFLQVLMFNYLFKRYGITKIECTSSDALLPYYRSNKWDLVTSSEKGKKLFKESSDEKLPDIAKHYGDDKGSGYLLELIPDLDSLNKELEEYVMRMDEECNEGIVSFC